MRRRVAALPNVTFVDSHDVIEPCAAAGVVTGVRIAHRGNGAATVLDADLVVDAMGRAARTPAFLDTLGYGRPRENRSPVMLAYSSQSLCIPKGRLNKQLVAFNQGPGRPGGMLLACEHDTWMMAVARSAEDGRAPTDFAEMLTLAQDALPAELTDGLRWADAVGEIAMFRSPAAVWRRYEQLPKFPRGLLVMGDALCSPNPVYGQGMTMAALHRSDVGPEFVRTMAAYNAEMNRRIYAAAARLSDAERRKPRGAFWSSIHGTLCHLLWGDQAWMSRFDAWPKPAVVQKQSATLINDFDELRRLRSDADARG